MKKYSAVYKRDGFLFRYDFDRCVVQYVCKPSAEDLADNEEWIAKHGRPLFDIEDGYEVIDAVGLRPENWKNRELRNDYLDEWIFELREAVAWEMHYEGLI